MKKFEDICQSYFKKIDTSYTNEETVKFLNKLINAQAESEKLTTYLASNNKDRGASFRKKGFMSEKYHVVSYLISRYLNETDDEQFYDELKANHYVPKTVKIPASKYLGKIIIPNCIGSILWLAETLKIDWIEKEELLYATKEEGKSYTDEKKEKKDLLECIIKQIDAKLPKTA